MSNRSEHGGFAVGNQTPLQAFALTRLNHLLEQRSRFDDLLPNDDWRRKLIARALYSTYQDCVEQGLSVEAKKLIAANRNPESN